MREGRAEVSLQEHADVADVADQLERAELDDARGPREQGGEGDAGN